jgi:hypothetical protein
MDYFKFETKEITAPAGARFRSIKPSSPNVQKAQKELLSLNWIMKKYYGKVFVAGGYVTGALTGFRANDIDIFFVCSEKEALEIMNDLIDIGKFNEIRKTNHVVTVWRGYVPHQFILRLYDHPSEILEGFDVDCCCVLYDGEKIMTNERGSRAINGGFNVLDLKRRSTSYEYRLVKNG